MRPRLLPLAAACGAVFLVPASLSASAAPPDVPEREPSVRVPVRAAGPPTARTDGEVRAAELLDAVRGCRPISDGRYRSDDETEADITVCGGRGVVHWKSDLDVDCDGRPGRRCNAETDPMFADTTAFQQSDGRQLSAEQLPYIVVPGSSDIWSPARSGIRAGTVAALVHRGRVVYAVVGDTGPTELIGEASYAAARALGVSPDPIGGGVARSEVTYILFPGTTAEPLESHRAAVTAGRAAARTLVRSAAR
ncbi:glycoside hydrolase family 75 protein [Streptomyces sp. SID5785]|uniref:glycoside hydrolase family 75 protein n=1 Tax=Streptomyces sp. SID5785 TaxID=2690309 RepID=UPI0031BA31DE